MENDFDPLDLSQGIPYSELARLRDEAPVYKVPSGYWFLSRYDDVLAAAEAIDTFKSSFRSPGVVVPDEEMLLSEVPEPRHGWMRRILNSAVAVHSIGSVRPFVREFGERLLDDLLKGGRGELINDYCIPIPNSVIAHLLGVPAQDFPLWARWADDVVQGDYATENRNERGEGLAGGFPEFAAYVDGKIAERRAQPDAPDDLINRLMTGDVQGEKLTDVELRTQIIFLLVAGNETTRNLIGNILSRLATDPELYRKLRERRELAPNMVEETLRLQPSVVYLLRDCIKDTQIRGVDIRKGEKVVFGLASANRDERKFENPDEFRLDRPDPKLHLAFGAGRHVCPGAALARLEATTALEVMLEKVAELRAEPGYQRERIPVFWSDGPVSVPVELIAA
ncbi:MAG: cytochrome P450 [Deltaproteobacteria bacterium]|nr:cytochrome P450 [Deltaproteobacteria bacterium]